MAASYKQIVENSHRIFTVFTSATLSFYVSDLFLEKESWRFWTVPAVIALMLRYLVGSAVHLDKTYTGAAEGEEPSCVWLFFDIVVLVIFGFLAVFLIRGPADIDAFMWRAFLFVSAGFIWSFIAVARSGRQTKIGETWMIIDGVQAIGTWILIQAPMATWLSIYPWISTVLWTDDPHVAKAKILTSAYLIFLFFDLREMAKWART